MHIKASKPIRQLGLVGPGGAPLPSPKVALGFCFGTLHWPFVRSLLALEQADNKRMADGEERTCHHFIPQQGLYVGLNRNILVEKFLATDAEWFLQIDTDIQFPTDIVERMLAAARGGRKIVAASVPLGFDFELGVPLPSTALMQGATSAEWEYVPADHWCPTCNDRRIEVRAHSDGYQCTRNAAHQFALGDARVTGQRIVSVAGVETDAVATAVVLIHRSVFTDIADRFGRCWFLHRLEPRLNSRKSFDAWLLWKEKYGDLQRLEDDWIGDAAQRDREFVSIGEDLAFCLRAAEVGHKSYCVKVPGLRHFKMVPLSHDVAERELAPLPKLAEIPEAVAQ